MNSVYASFKMILQIAILLFKLFIALFIVALLAWFIYVVNARKTLPPGPFPLPFIGNMWYFSNFCGGYSESWMRFAETFGSPCTFWLCCEPMIIASTHEQAQFIMSGGGRDIFVSRRKSMLMDAVGHSDGTTFIPYGPQWLAQRRILHKCFRTHISDQLIETQCELVIDRVIMDQTDRPISPALFAQELSRNVIQSLLFFHRKTQLSAIDRHHMTEMRSVRFFQFEPRSWPDFFPILRSLPFLVQNGILRLTTPAVAQFRKRITAAMVEIIEEHKENMILNGGVETDLLDGLINAYRHEEAMGNSFVKEKNLRYLATDLNSDTTETVLSAILAQLAFNDQDQQKCYEEIKAEFGMLTPTVEKRTQLPYLEACIYETLRTIGTAELNCSHFVNTKTTVIGGYTIQRGTMVVPLNYYSALTSSNGFVGENPHTFKPARFLDANGRFNSRKDDFWPYSAAMRECAGKSVAQRFLLHIVACLLQKFRFTLEPVPELPTQIRSLDDLHKLLWETTTKLIISFRM